MLPHQIPLYFVLYTVYSNLSFLIDRFVLEAGGACDREFVHIMLRGAPWWCPRRPLLDPTNMRVILLPLDAEDHALAYPWTMVMLLRETVAPRRNVGL